MKIQHLLVAALVGGVMTSPVWAAPTDTRQAGYIMITAAQLT